MSNSDSDDSTITLRGNHENMSIKINNKMANKNKQKMQKVNANEMTDSDDSCSGDVNKFKMDIGETSTSNINQQQQENRPKTELYKPTDKQPFYVNAVCKDSEIDTFDLGMQIQKFKIEKVLSIKKLSKNKASITLSDWKNANKLIKLDGYEAMSKYELVIPSSYVHSEGIVRGIPTYLTNDEIPLIPLFRVWPQLLIVCQMINTLLEIQTWLSWN